MFYASTTLLGSGLIANISLDKFRLLDYAVRLGLREGGLLATESEAGGRKPAIVSRGARTGSRVGPCGWGIWSKAGMSFGISEKCALPLLYSAFGPRRKLGEGVPVYMVNASNLQKRVGAVG